MAEECVGSSGWHALRVDGQWGRAPIRAEEDALPPDVLLPVHPAEHDEAVDTLLLHLGGAGGLLALLGLHKAPDHPALPPGCGQG